MRREGAIKFIIERKYLEYANSCRYPLILVRVDLASKQAWYLWLQDWLLTQRISGSPFTSGQKSWTAWVPATQTVQAGLNGRLKTIALWEDKAQLALSLQDAMHAAARSSTSISTLTGITRFLQAAGAGPMGYAIPAAMGAKLVHPERPVVAVCGDGGFSMSMNGLMTAIEENIPIITVIFNNQMLGWSTHIRGPFAAQFHDFDHSAIAQAMGCHGVKVNTPQELAAALRDALIAEVPTVIDARISSELSYKALIATFDEAPDSAKARKETEAVR